MIHRWKRPKSMMTLLATASCSQNEPNPPCTIHFPSGLRSHTKSRYSPPWCMNHSTQASHIYKNSHIDEILLYRMKKSTQQDSSVSCRLTAFRTLHETTLVVLFSTFSRAKVNHSIHMPRLVGSDGANLKLGRPIPVLGHRDRKLSTTQLK